jgi:hypothetical protein
VIGAAAITGSVVLAFTFPVYKPWVSKQLIYGGHDAKQVVADGEDVYLLKESGNIDRIWEGLHQVSQSVDPGTGSRQIAPAGGVLYVLKENGNIWAVKSISASERQDAFQLKDSGTRTKAILSAGETLYVLKENGNIFKYFTIPADAQHGHVTEGFALIDDGTNTTEMTSSGSALYVLKDTGNVWQAVPSLKQPFQDIRHEADVKSIRADGKSLYFIKKDGSTWKYKEHVIQRDRVAREIEVLGGIVYILTNENKIFRYNSQTDNLRELTEAGEDNKTIAPYYQDLFVIKTDGTVWRYSEGLLKR